jgi:hypothetical protein
LPDERQELDHQPLQGMDDSRCGLAGAHEFVNGGERVDGALWRDIRTEQTRERIPVDRLGGSSQ